MSSRSCSYTSFCLFAITIAVATAAVTIPTAPVVRQSRPVLQPAPITTSSSSLPPQKQPQPQQQSAPKVKPQTIPVGVVRPNVQVKPQLVPQPAQQPQLRQPLQVVPSPIPQPDEDGEPSSPEEILDVYFDFIKNNDENNCLMRLICQIGYNRTAFGNFGEQVAGFFTEIESSSGAAAQYRTAFQTHMTEPDVAKCVDKYPNCQYETHDMIEVGNDLMTKNLTNLQLDDVKRGPPAWIGQAN